MQSSMAFPLSTLSPQPNPGGAAATDSSPSGTTPLLDPCAVLAHDASNILGALLLYCDLLRLPEVLQPRHRHYADELGELAARGTRLIERLLCLTEQRLGSSHPSQPSPSPEMDAPAPYFPAEKLRELEPLLRSLAFSYGKVSFDLECRPGYMVSPPAETLERIALNLVFNAAQAAAATAQAHGRVRVHFGFQMGSPVLEVTDNGPGMSSQALNAFLDAAAHPDDDAGLGHRIVRAEIAATGAKMDIRSAQNAGTTVRIIWPAAAASTPLLEAGCGATRRPA